MSDIYTYLQPLLDNAPSFQHVLLSSLANVTTQAATRWPRLDDVHTLDKMLHQNDANLLLGEGAGEQACGEQPVGARPLSEQPLGTERCEHQGGGRWACMRQEMGIRACRTRLLEMHMDWSLSRVMHVGTRGSSGDAVACVKHSAAVMRVAAHALAQVHGGGVMQHIKLLLYWHM